MIEVKSLRKRYRSTLAVDDLTFTVRPGAVTGFLGPNGAGKSTTMRMILGLDRPCAGEALIAGRRYAQLEYPLRTVGALLDAKWVHPNRSARAHLRWLARSNSLPPGRVDEVLDQVGLTAVADRRAGAFSLGMSQRLGIAGALLGDPGILLFDEPVNGLDPEGIIWIRQFMQRLAGEGRCVLVSSHLLPEMALTATELVVIGRGRLIAESRMEQFVGRFTQRYVVVRSPQAGLLAVLLREAEVGPVTTRSDGSLLVADAELSVVGEIAGRHQITVHELSERAASLEQAFLEATGEATEYRARDADGHQSAQARASSRGIR